MMRSGWLERRRVSWSVAEPEGRNGYHARIISSTATCGARTWRTAISWVCRRVVAVAGVAVDVGLADEGQVTALLGLPQAQLTMAHRLKGSGGICANNRQMMCETWLCRRQSSGRLTASATGSAEVGGSCWGEHPGSPSGRFRLWAAPRVRVRRGLCSQSLIEACSIPIGRM